MATTPQPKPKKNTVDLKAVDMKISKAKIAMRKNRLFYLTLLYQLGLRENDSINTARTDGTTIEYNPAFFADLTTNEIAAVFEHELQHIINKHHLRYAMQEKYKRNHVLFNMAADYAINPRIKGLPKGCLIDMVNCADDTVEHIFEDLQTKNPQANMPSPDSVLVGDVTEPSNVAKLSKSKADNLAKEIDGMVIRAAMQVADKPGNGIDAKTAKLIKGIKTRNINWIQILQSFLEKISRDDYTWQKPNKRYLQSTGFYLPTLESKKPGTILCYVDVSGSLNIKQITVSLNHVRRLASKFGINIKIVLWNTRLVDVFDIKQLSVDKILHGGGTTFTNCWIKLPEICKHAKIAKQDISGIIFFTDFECRQWPVGNPGAPVIWFKVPLSTGQYINSKRYPGTPKRFYKVPRFK